MWHDYNDETSIWVFGFQIKELEIAPMSTELRERLLWEGGGCDDWSQWSCISMRAAWKVSL